eukprot:CAMPEP_0197848778 /NCGR_PEP_ID=MMETSP1438-20131217/10018_1 /TAXON_ID=1461541 /ORGANISM="Pterosperma sp., Strain CCMP1384" /LENGTH=131 /DNA_ID=CAMNT_0043461189 /DNA_START=264 /DNA_END=659 /DNA_ORIENTATION=+
MVEVFRFARHRKYPKIIKHRKKYMAHDEREVANLGDRVRIKSCRPLSKNKTFNLEEILVKAPQFTSGDVKAQKGNLSLLPPAAAAAAVAKKEERVKELAKVMEEAELSAREAEEETEGESKESEEQDKANK